MASEQYKKLVGRSLLSVQSCYLGKDHLLILDGRYRERAKRIRYQDIEALLICPTKTGNVVSLISALSGFALLVAALANANSVALWIWLALAVIAWGIFALGLYGKGSALMGIQTAVQTVHLEGASSMRKARTTETRLNERIVSVQGRLSVEDIAQYKAQKKSRPPLPAKAPPPLAGSGPSSPPDLKV